MAEFKPRMKVGSKGGVWGGLPESARFINYYEGASRTYRLGNKGVSGASANNNIGGNLSVLVNRSRNVVANNPYGENAVTTYTSNVVGGGFIAKFPDKKQQSLWDQWVQECDADGLSNFTGICELMARGEFIDGEMLLRRRLRRPSDGLAVPLQIQAIECDHLDVGFTDEMRKIKMGIQYNGLGARQAYHLFKSHPGEVGINTGQRVPVPASDIIHLFRRLRAGQSRGVPKLSNILVRLYEIDEMQDGMLAKQKIAQLFGWIIKKKSPDVGDLEQEDNTVNRDVVGEETGEVTEDGTIITSIKSGGVHYLDEDEDVIFSTPDGIGPNYIPWLQQELRICAKGVGLTYEQFTGDLTGVNYTSIRAGLIEFRRVIEQIQYNLYVFRLCRTVAGWFNDAAVMSGKWAPKDYWNNRSSHLPKFKSQGWDWVDPIKDKMADLLDVRAGFNSRRGVVDSRGLDFDNINDDLAADIALNLILDSIPAKTTKTGILQTIVDKALEDEEPTDKEKEDV
jgi:lambda family phage portal protein